MARAKKSKTKKKSSAKRKTSSSSKRKAKKKSSKKASKKVKKKVSKKKTKKKTTTRKKKKKVTKKKATKKKKKTTSKKTKSKAKKKSSSRKKTKKKSSKKTSSKKKSKVQKKGPLASLTSFVKKLTGSETVSDLTGARAPRFNGPSLNSPSLQLSDYSNKTLILYFYPKDSTSGCTRQGEEFRDAYKSFRKAGAEILGVSRDSLKSHEKFAKKYNFPFDLLSDPDEKVCKSYGVLKMKNMYGRQFMGIERSTFVIDKNGTVIKEWRKVKVPGHVQEVLNFVKSL